MVKFCLFVYLFVCLFVCLFYSEENKQGISMLLNGAILVYHELMMTAPDDSQSMARHVSRLMFWCKCMSMLVQ